MYQESSVEKLLNLRYYCKIKINMNSSYLDSKEAFFFYYLLATYEVLKIN